MKHRTIAALIALVLAELALLAARAGEAPGLRAMIGQMVMVGFRGDRPGDPWVETLTRQIAAGKVGGVMLLGYNVSDRAGTRALNRALAAASAGPPLFVALDQEGGAVVRLRETHGFRRVPSARTVAGSMDPAGARALYGAMAADLAGWGFNVNFGPVVDLGVEPANPIIGTLGRSYSADPAVVTDFASAFVLAHREHGVLTAPKHFPGHGSGTVDSHLALPDITQSWSEAELVPFRELAACGLADMVMVGHLFHRGLQAGEPSGPTSLSPAVVEGLLGRDLGFPGVVVTDDLQMEAVAAAFPLEETVIRAVAAGASILLFANFREPDVELPEKIAAILEAEAARDPTIAAAIELAYRKIVALKDTLPVSRR